MYKSNRKIVKSASENVSKRRKKRMMIAMRRTKKTNEAWRRARRMRSMFWNILNVILMKQSHVGC